jgi:hypothetical protein
MVYNVCQIIYPNLAGTIGISANAALRMKHHLQQVIKDRDADSPWGGLLLIDVLAGRQEASR